MKKSKKFLMTICFIVFGVLILIYKVYKSLLFGSGFLKKNSVDIGEQKKNADLEKDEDGYYSITKKNDDNFKILQLTDLHIGGGYLSRHEDLQALSIVRKVILTTKPDLIVITGDLTCPSIPLSLSVNNLNSIKIITDMLEKTEIPYAICFGNHDSTSKATHSRKKLFEFIKEQPHSVMVEPQIDYEINGFSNYLVKLKNSDGSLNSVMFMLDSNDYTTYNKKKVYDYIRDDQVEWYEYEINRLSKKAGKIIPSHLFFHMPVKEFDEAWEAATNAEDNAKYFYGTRDEKISYSPIESKIFDRALELGSTKGIFCGHDHLNDFSVEYKDIRLTYGQSIDCILYAKNLSQHKGATLLTIDKTGKFSVKAIKHR